MTEALADGTDAGQGAAQGALRQLGPGAAALGIDLTFDQVELFRRFFSLLKAANQTLNLTAIHEPEMVVRRHFLDSLSVLAALESAGARLTIVAETPFSLGKDSQFHDAHGANPDVLNGVMSVVDVGTGGGLPGLALAIARPNWSITLLDSVAKKIRFVEDTIRQLKLPSARAIAGRAEDLGRSSMRDSFDLCLCRAVASTPVLVEYCAPLVRNGGRIALYKSGDAKREVASSSRALEEFGCVVGKIHDVPPDIVAGHDRFIIVLEKLHPTPDRYPRRVGLARSRPL